MPDTTENTTTEETQAVEESADLQEAQDAAANIFGFEPEDSESKEDETNTTESPINVEDEWEINIEDDEEDKKEESDKKEEEKPEEEQKASPEEDSEVKKEETEESKAAEDKIQVQTSEGLVDLTLSDIKEKHPEVLENIKSGISGAKEIAKRFTELDNQKKSYEQEIKAINEYINGFAKQTAGGNILGGLTYLAEFANIPPYLLKEQLINSLKPEIEQRSLMGETELNNLRLKEENEYLQKKHESETQKWAYEQATEAQQRAAQELEAQIATVRETQEITDEEWEKAVKHLDENLPPEVQEIPVKQIEEQVLHQRHLQAQEETLTSVIEPYIDNIDEEHAEDVYEFMQAHPTFSPEMVQSLLEDVLIEEGRLKVAENTQENKEEKEEDQEDIIVDWDI